MLTLPQIYWSLILRSLTYGRFMVERMIKSCCRRERRRTQGLLVQPLTPSWYCVCLYHISEGILAQDPHVLTAVMFGRGRFQNGVLIDPKPQFAFDPKDETKLEAFRKLIWQVSVSLCVSSGSQFKIQADCGAPERLCTTTLASVQGGTYIHSHLRYNPDQDNCIDDNRSVSV